MRTMQSVGGPGFVQDPASIVRNSGRQVDWSRVSEAYRTGGVVATVTTSGATLAGVTAIPVVALTAAIPSGTILDFAGAGKFAKLTADAAVGATSLAVEATDADIGSGVAATYTAAGTGNKRIPAGTVVSEFITGNVRLIAPTATAGGTAVGILATDANENAASEALSGYGVIVGARVFEPLLPESTGTPRALPSALRTALLALDGGGISFEPYTDSTT